MPNDSERPAPDSEDPAAPEQPGKPALDQEDASPTSARPAKPPAGAAKARSARARPARDEDDDFDDEDDDDLEGEDREPPRRGAAATRRRAAARPLPRQSWDERTIDSPSRLTLGMLGSVCLATLTMWGAAKFACNAHPAETRKPRQVSTAELARDPKGAAFELQQRWSSYDFAGALELASGEVAQAIERDRARCRQQGGCEEQKNRLAKEPLVLAALVSREPKRATVKLTTLGGLGGKAEYLADVVPEGGKWKVSARRPYVAPPPVAESAADAGALTADGGASQADAGASQTDAGATNTGAAASPSGTVPVKLSAPTGTVPVKPSAPTGTVPVKPSAPSGSTPPSTP